MCVYVCVCVLGNEKKRKEAGKKLKLSGELDTRREETTTPLTLRRRRRRCCCCRRRRQVQSVTRAWRPLWAIYVSVCAYVHARSCCCSSSTLFPIFFFFFLLLRSVNKLSIKRQQKQTGKRNTATIFSYEVIVGSDGDRGSDAATRGLFIKSNNSNTFVGYFEVKFFGENSQRQQRARRRRIRRRRRRKRRRGRRKRTTT